MKVRCTFRLLYRDDTRHIVTVYIRASSASTEGEVVALAYQKRVQPEQFVSIEKIDIEVESP